MKSLLHYNAWPRVRVLQILKYSYPMSSFRMHEKWSIQSNIYLLCYHVLSAQAALNMLLTPERFTCP